MVTPQAVQQWAKGESAPRGVRLKRLAAATGKPEHWFFMPPDAGDDDLSMHKPPRQLDEKKSLCSHYSTRCLKLKSFASSFTQKLLLKS